MPATYYLDEDPPPGAEPKVHESGCDRLPRRGPRPPGIPRPPLYLGRFDSPRQALQFARLACPSTEPCRHCSPAAQTSSAGRGRPE